ncbi:hypothetical protein [Streptomyces sp. NBC_01483]|uniref:hypothetical protein n=1 Tax=Streptomyces sp. NBC_01483 TaxID=2903883 RepID=UPI002E30EA53|nr:hypothetical protein [Streptomyces sp. NBC_01483]
MAGVPGQSPVELAVFDVSSGSANRTAYAWDPGSSSNLTDLAVTPDGKDVVTASGAPYKQEVFKLSDLSEDGSYATNPYPNAVDIAPNGAVAAGTFSWYDPHVHIFEPGVSEPVRQYDFPNTGGSSGSDTLAASGLAWAPDASKLFAVSYNDSNVYSLRVLDDPTKAGTAHVVTAAATATRAKSLTVTGKVEEAVTIAGNDHQCP